MLMVLGTGCFLQGDPVSHADVERESKVPTDVAKRGPETDRHPPIIHSDEYRDPVPLPYPVNTAGAEDSPFILPDGNTLYLFFTPDVRIPHEQQVLDGVTGIYVTHRSEDGWSKPERVWLEQPGKLSLDGAVSIWDDEMWFCSAREGFTGVNMFTAKLVDEAWVDWQYAGDRLMKELQVGEVHLHEETLYYHSERFGGRGSLDIWTTTRNGNEWSDPVNVEAINTTQAEGWPFVSSDGSTLWFTRDYRGTPGIFRSVNDDGVWGEPELIASQFAGEPTLDDAGNLYFTHHYFEDGKMIEADIYVAHRK